MLKVKQDTVFVVDYDELDRFIFKETGYYIQDLFSNSTLIINVNAQLSKYDRENFEKHKAGKRVDFMLSTILCCLCADGKLEAGKYIINYSW